MLAISARRHEVSENLLLERILKSRLFVDPLVDALQVMGIGRRTVMAIIDKVDSDSLERLAFSQGKETFLLARDLFESNGLTLTYFEFVTRILGKEAKWFRVEGEYVKPERVTLFHSCGMKWSCYLRGYVMGAHEVVSQLKLKTHISDESISIMLPSSPEG